MTEKELIPWGMPVDYPVVDIRRLLGLDGRDWRNPAFIADLGCGSSATALWLRNQLPHCILSAIDNVPEVGNTGRIYDGDLPINFTTADLTRLPNHLLQLCVLGQPFDAVIANNLFCNLTNNPDDPFNIAFSIWLSLKPGGYVFILDHLFKNIPPYGSPTVHAKYQRRYTEASAQGRPFGDVWTSSPPRWVHHYRHEELLILFPPELYHWQSFLIQPYVGDSGNATNSFRLTARKK